MRSWLDELGLAVAGATRGSTRSSTSLPELAAELAVLGSDRLVLSWIEPPASDAEARAAVATIADAAQRVNGAGLRFGFHNHWAELERFEGGSVLDSLLGLPAEDVWLELDLGWAWEAGVDPVELLERARGRSTARPRQGLSRARQPGVLPGRRRRSRLRPRPPAALAAGVEWLLVEQDETEGPGLDAVKRSFAAVQRFLQVAA